jgi:glycosyltransferase involved in cell wall biosynthesis
VNIAFYAPLKSPDHPVPSGDRQMGRLLIAALSGGGHTIEVASNLRSFITEPSPAAVAALESRAGAEIARLAAQWQISRPPDMWFCYHPYYKAPDFIGPALCRRFGVTYVTAEASYAAKRDAGGWARLQAEAIAGVKMAALNICFTRRDRDGLEQAAPDAAFADLKPFINTAGYCGKPGRPSGHGLAAVAMMRRGDKLRSFHMLAAALELLAERPWHLTIVGGGPAKAQIEALFRKVDPRRIRWVGEIAPEYVRDFLYDADLYVWPGCGEAYGLAYLEAQVAGLPVVAQKTAGVPEVVRDGVTGILTPEGDVCAFADAVRSLLDDPPRRSGMAAAARQFVHGERSLSTASATLDQILKERVRR